MSLFTSLAACTVLIGTVSFDDGGRVPDIRIYDASGTYVVTDDHGRFTFPCMGEGNVVLKLDSRTVPHGYAVEGGGIRLIRLGAAMGEVNFVLED